MNNGYSHKVVHLEIWIGNHKWFCNLIKLISFRSLAQTESHISEQRKLLKKKLKTKVLPPPPPIPPVRRASLSDHTGPRQTSATKEVLPAKQNNSSNQVAQGEEVEVVTDSSTDEGIDNSAEEYDEAENDKPELDHKSNRESFPNHSHHKHHSNHHHNAHFTSDPASFDKTNQQSSNVVNLDRLRKEESALLQEILDLEEEQRQVSAANRKSVGDDPMLVSVYGSLSPAGNTDEDDELQEFQRIEREIKLSELRKCLLLVQKQIDAYSVRLNGGQSVVVDKLEETVQSYQEQFEELDTLNLMSMSMMERSRERQEMNGTK